MRPGGSSSPMIAVPVSDLPAPDSPTTPSTSPGAMSKLTSSMATSVPRRVLNSTRRWRTCEERLRSSLSARMANFFSHSPMRSLLAHQGLPLLASARLAAWPRRSSACRARSSSSNVCCVRGGKPLRGGTSHGHLVRAGRDHGALAPRAYCVVDAVDDHRRSRSGSADGTWSFSMIGVGLVVGARERGGRGR